MKVQFNEELGLLALGIVQPATTAETLGFLLESFPSLRERLSEPQIDELFRKWSEQRLIMQVAKGPQLFSLTAHGNDRLSTRARRYRDKTRIFLLKAIRSSRLLRSGEVSQELAGASPAPDLSTTIKEGAGGQVPPLMKEMSSRCATLLLP